MNNNGLMYLNNEQQAEISGGWLPIGCSTIMVVAGMNAMVGDIPGSLAFLALAALQC